MATPLFSFDQPVVLLGGGTCAPDMLRQLGRLYPLIAADGGADHLRGAVSLLNTEKRSGTAQPADSTHDSVDLIPHAIIGDLDSLQQRPYWESITRVVRVEEQDTTDFEKCLYAVAAPLYIALGFTGKRLDHTLAALHVLARYCEHKSVMLVGEEDIVFVSRRSVRLPLSAGCRLSIFPLETVHYRQSTGLLYPLDGLELAPVTMIGTSNEVTLPDVLIEKEPHCNGCYAVLLPVSAFDSVMSVLHAS